MMKKILTLCIAATLMRAVHGASAPGARRALLSRRNRDTMMASTVPPGMRVTISKKLLDYAVARLWPVLVDELETTTAINFDLMKQKVNLHGIGLGYYNARREWTPCFSQLWPGFSFPRIASAVP